MSILWPILLIAVQPKATILIFIKPSQQAKTFYLQSLARGTQKTAKSEIYKVAHRSMQLRSKLPKCYTSTGAKTSKIKTPKTYSKFYLTLNTTIELIKPKLLLYTKITPKCLYNVVPQVLPTQC